jgi:hypothetical protein
MDDAPVSPLGTRVMRKSSNALISVPEAGEIGVRSGTGRGANSKLDDGPTSPLGSRALRESSPALISVLESDETNGSGDRRSAGRAVRHDTSGSHAPVRAVRDVPRTTAASRRRSSTGGGSNTAQSAAARESSQTVTTPTLPRRASKKMSRSLLQLETGSGSSPRSAAWQD